MRRIFVFSSAILAFGTCLPASSTTTDSLQQTVETEIDTKLESYLSKQKNTLSVGDLATLHRGADGSKGISISVSGAYPMPPRSYVESLGFLNVEEYRIYQRLCFADQIVVARATASASGVPQKRNMIYTVTSFDIEETWFQQETAPLPELAFVINPGGEVIFDGEKIRITYSDYTGYIAGERYLLLLHKEKGGSGWYSSSNEPIHINSGRLQFKGQIMFSVTPGSSVQAAREIFQRVHTIASCPAAQQLQ